MTRSHQGFTLVELLMVIMIIGILAGVSITVTRQVYHTARVAKTNATLQKLDRVILEMYAEYENRRVPSPNFGSSPVAAQVTQAARLWFLRDMIRMEMPCNWEEVRTAPISFRFQHDTNAPPTALVYVPPSPLRQLYEKAYEKAIYDLTKSVVDGGQGLSSIEAQRIVNRYASAKCLFLIVMYGNPEARELFFDSEIATDDDGLSYFVDGWGNPIYFLRWAPGLVLSERQPCVLGPNQNAHDWDSLDDKKANASNERGDPLDPTEVGGIIKSYSYNSVNSRWEFEIDLTKEWPSTTQWPNTSPQRGWALLPVVMSSGGVRNDDGSFSGACFGMMLSPPGDVPAVDPFYWPLGAPDDVLPGNYAVIHNHSSRR